MKVGTTNWLFVIGFFLSLIGFILLIMGMGGMSLPVLGTADNVVICGIFVLVYATMFVWSSNYVIVICPKCGFKGDING